MGNAHRPRFRFNLRELFIAFTAVAVLAGSAGGMASLCRNATELRLLAWLICTTVTTLLLCRRNHDAVSAPATPFVSRVIMAAALVFCVNMVAAMLTANAINSSALQAVDWFALAVLAGMGGVAAVGVLRMTQR